MFDRKQEGKIVLRSGIKAEKIDGKISHLKQLFFSKLFKLIYFSYCVLVNMIHATESESLHLVQVL